MAVNESIREFQKKADLKYTRKLIGLSVGLHSWYMCRMREKIDYCWYSAMRRVGERRDDSKRELGGMCEENHLRACMGLGHLEKSDGNLGEAEKIFNKSCGMGYVGGCWFGGRVRERLGDIVGAKDFYGKVCAEKIKLGCDALARLKK